MYIDLQLHSTYSDGYLTPSQLVNFLTAKKIKVASLTDHHTVGGLDEFKRTCRKYKIKAIAGLELYTTLKQKKFNLLWYNFDDKSPALHNLLRLSQNRRRRQMRRILLKLKRLGLTINQERILDKFSRYQPLNRIVSEIFSVAANRNKIIKLVRHRHPREDEIIQAFFKNRRLGIIEESYIGFNNILKLRRLIGGQLILNHPGKHNQIDKNFIAQLKKLGLDGLEVISPHHSIGAIMYAQALAREFALIMTGGSDFHRQERRAVKIKSCYDYFKIDSKYLSQIEKIIN